MHKLIWQLEYYSSKLDYSQHGDFASACNAVSEHVYKVRGVKRDRLQKFGDANSPDVVNYTPKQGTYTAIDSKRVSAGREGDIIGEFHGSHGTKLFNLELLSNGQIYVDAVDQSAWGALVDESRHSDVDGALRNIDMHLE
ncbi:hypothetical protein HOD30_00510 [Candidatus Peregrinibacteria bacterium]|jgi:hypothetical protein|nr:hypothetical protein [Candidatus Peregrinibacteria bacterium]MBT4631976.1 hypothetical protein [Candidatus Peregrinibacteria bacterium]MBT5517086.1 hypothetical protein [Candidatus Peregrinibacteria bacterium]MBT5823635.1 hypothetical protein [Candidatus Peregrinibacteria bacterium]